MSKRRTTRQIQQAADALLFTAHGTVQLLDDDDNVLWSSDDDDEFTDEFGDEFLEEEDTEEILAFLVEHGMLHEGQEVDQCVDALEDSEGVDLDDVQGV